MNHKKAIPAKGTRFSANATVFELVLSHAPGSSGSAGTEMRKSQKATISSAEKRIPATAAAFGVRRFAWVRYPFCIERFRPIFSLVNITRDACCCVDHRLLADRNEASARPVKILDE